MSRFTIILILGMIFIIDGMISMIMLKIKKNRKNTNLATSIGFFTAGLLLIAMDFLLFFREDF